MTAKSKPTSKNTSRPRPQTRNKKNRTLAAGDLLELPVLSWPEAEGVDAASVEAEEEDAPVSGYEDRYVCFIDILGFKELINASAGENPSITPSMILNALMIQHESIERSFCNLAGLAETSSDLRVHSFSDCVVASTSHNAQGLGLLLYFCWQISSDWLSKHFLSRGAVTCGKLIHRLNQGGAPLIFGPAFNQAYRLESEVADFPRIIFSRQVRLGYEALQAYANAAPHMAGLINVTRGLVHVFDDGPTGLDLFCHLRSKGLDTGDQSFADDAQQYQLALLSHMSNACDTPHYFRKVLWLVSRFNTAILHTPYAGNHIPGFRAS